jgi:diguanylate cyclase (GGDEF)-like protein/PAS domain S-box-containing protein
MLAILVGFSAVGFLLSEYYLSRINQHWAVELTEQRVQFDKQRTLQPLLREIELARAMAAEPAVIAMATNEHDPAVRQQAIKVIEQYRLKFKDHSYFAAIAESGHYYFNNDSNQFATQQPTYTLSSSNPNDQWFFATKNSGKDYRINVERSSRLGVTKVWVNVLVKSGQQVLGIVGTGIDINTFIKQTVDVDQSGFYNLFIDGDMAIQLDQDKSLIDYGSIAKKNSQRSKLDLLLKDPADNENLRQVMRQLEKSDGKVATLVVNFKGTPHLLGVAYLPTLDWFSLTLMSNKTLSAVADTSFEPLLFALLFTMALLAVSIALHYWVLRPVSRLKSAMLAIQQGHYETDPPLVGSGEIYDLSLKFKAMVEFVRNAKSALEYKDSQQTQFEQFRSDILERLTGEEPLASVLKAIVIGVEQLNPQMMCSILLLDAAGKHLGHIVAPSLPAFYNESIEGVEIGIGVGSCGTAAFTGKRVIVDDIATHAYWADYKELAKSAGLGACWSQPILSSSAQVLGTFAIYHRDAHIPLAADIVLIEQAARLASIAISRRQAENELKIAATAFESQEGMIVTNANKLILRVNNAFTKITGYSALEAVGQSPRFISSGRQDHTFYQEMWGSVDNLGAWEGEIWNRRKNGEVYPEHLTITAVKNDDGVVTNYVATLTDITQSKAASDEIKNLAFYDPLTQLPNRRLLLDRLMQAAAASQRSKQIGALLFLDLDHFKTLNDTLGHDVGDMLLQEVAARLTSCVRETDTVARIGGDEFVLLLEDLNEQALAAAAQTETVAEKIIYALGQPYQLGTHLCYSTPSIGATLFGVQLLEVEELLKQADIAMYEAKNSGRNMLRFFDPKMQEAIDSRVNLEYELRNAIDQEQFQLHYQIQMDGSGLALGAEALIRWQHPQRGMISPVNFIPLAEETGLILPIGQWVFDTACAQLKSWEQHALTRKLTLSVNVSAKQLHQPDFVAQVQSAVTRHGINPNLVNLELTESMLLENIDSIIISMNLLKDIGIRFELDDFGTGYSSLQYLKKLPLYRVKIDQSFVRDIAIDSSDRTLVHTIITMAHSLDLQVIAEGVETEDQRQFLQNQGCKHYQGYLFSKPLPLDQFEAMLRMNAAASELP